MTTLSVVELESDIESIEAEKKAKKDAYVLPSQREYMPGVSHKSKIQDRREKAIGDKVNIYRGGHK